MNSQIAKAAGEVGNLLRIRDRDYPQNQLQKEITEILTLNGIEQERQYSLFRKRR